MEELDIRDGYELFYIIKSSLENWHNKDFDISCRRVPVIVLGDGDEAKQALHLLKEISPIDFFGYYEAYEERYGVRSANGNSVITGMSGYVHVYLDNSQMYFHSKWQVELFCVRIVMNLILVTYVNGL